MRAAAIKGRGVSVILARGWGVCVSGGGFPSPLLVLLLVDFVVV